MWHWQQGSFAAPVRWKRGRGWLRLTLLVLVYIPGQARPEEPVRLTLDSLFVATDYHEDGPPTLQWSAKRSGYTTLEKAEGGGRDLVWHDPASDSKEILVQAHHFIPAGENHPLPIESYTFLSNEAKLLLYTNSKRVWRYNTRGDYWVLDITSGELSKIGGNAPPSSLSHAKFSPDGTKVAYVRENNIHVQDLQSRTITALTKDGSEKTSNGIFDWVYEEELQLRDGFRWSPDSKSIAYWQIDTQGVREFTLVNNLEGLYPRVQPIPYPKVGQQNPAARVGIVSATGGATRWLEIPGDPREHYLAQMDWTDNPRQILLQQFNRLQNANKLLRADLNTGRVEVLHTEKDDAWVENSNARLHTFANHGKLLWVSERDGWQHVYSLNLANKEWVNLTKGNQDVIQIEGLDTKQGWFYFSASPENATQRYLYRARFEPGKEKNAPFGERVTPKELTGSHYYNISPDGQWALHTYSNFNTPPVVSLVRLADHKTIKVFADNEKLKKKLAALAPTTTEFFRVPVAPGVELDGWCVLPTGFDKNKKYPVLFHVYGEPAGQTVLDQWSGRRHLWHVMLAQQGCVVMSLDNRGTPAPRGRAWRKCIYRQIGILASADQANGVRALLAQRSYLDAQRVGVWGWSGGGSMTLNALFRYPDVYQMGISIAPVPNQRFYDTIYQERYMGLPNDNSEGYRLGSPLTHAKNLRGKLLVIHGTGDDNVHYQGTEALINELVAHNKQFNMFAYPNRTHAIAEGKNTTRHLYNMMTHFVQTHLFEKR